MFENIQDSINNMNENKLFIGLMVITVTIGGRFIVDELNDVDLDGFLTPRLVRNFAFQIGLRDTNGDGTENQIIFQLRSSDVDIQRLITIPEIALGGDNPEQFIRHINLNYRLFYAEGGPLAMFSSPSRLGEQ